MSASIPPPGPASRDVAPLRIVLVYETLEMALLAKRVCDVLGRELAGSDAPVSLSIWRFDLFEIPPLANLATRHAEKADVVIVTARNLNRLPAGVKEWLEKWPVGREVDGGALITLFHPDDRIRASSCEEALLVWRAAERARMGFFCAATGRGPGCVDPGLTMKRNPLSRALPAHPDAAIAR